MLLVGKQPERRHCCHRTTDVSLFKSEFRDRAGDNVFRTRWPLRRVSLEETELSGREQLLHQHVGYSNPELRGVILLALVAPPPRQNRGKPVPVLHLRRDGARLESHHNQRGLVDALRDERSVHREPDSDCYRECNPLKALHLDLRFKR